MFQGPSLTFLANLTQLPTLSCYLQKKKIEEREKERERKGETEKQQQSKTETEKKLRHTLLDFCII